MLASDIDGYTHVMSMTALWHTLPNQRQVATAIGYANLEFWAFLSAVLVGPSHLYRSLRSEKMHSSPAVAVSGRPNIVTSMYLATPLMVLGCLLWFLQVQNTSVLIQARCLEVLCELCSLIQGTVNVSFHPGWVTVQCGRIAVAEVAGVSSCGIPHVVPCVFGREAMARGVLVCLLDFFDFKLQMGIHSERGGFQFRQTHAEIACLCLLIKTLCTHVSHCHPAECPTDLHTCFSNFMWRSVVYVGSSSFMAQACPAHAIFE
jgi:hypothetical protein